MSDTIQGRPAGQVSTTPSAATAPPLAVGQTPLQLPGESGAPPQIEMLFTMHVHDRYNWDQGKAVTIAGITVKDEQLGRLHRVGLAQEYDVDGDSTAKFVRWTHSGAAPSPQPNQAPGADERDGSRGDPGRERGRYADDVRGSGGTPRGR